MHRWPFVAKPFVRDKNPSRILEVCIHLHLKSCRDMNPLGFFIDGPIGEDDTEECQSPSLLFARDEVGGPTDFTTSSPSTQNTSFLLRRLVNPFAFAIPVRSHRVRGRRICFHLVLFTLFLATGTFLLGSLVGRKPHRSFVRVIGPHTRNLLTIMEEHTWQHPWRAGLPSSVSWDCVATVLRCRHLDDRRKWLAIPNHYFQSFASYFLRDSSQF